MVDDAVLMERGLMAAARAGCEADGIDPNSLIPASAAGLPDVEALVPAWQAYIRQARITLAMMSAGMGAILAHTQRPVETAAQPDGEMPHE